MILKRKWTLTGLMVPESLPGGPSPSDQWARRLESQKKEICSYLNAQSAKRNPIHVVLILSVTVQIISRPIMITAWLGNEQ